MARFFRRRCTVCACVGRPNPLQQLTIKGRWLEALGFTKGQPVSITTEHGQLIIRTAPATEGNA
ncbi:SymE family type I addiction module toxin [Serratia sp. D1N4]